MHVLYLGFSICYFKNSTPLRFGGRYCVSVYKSEMALPSCCQTVHLALFPVDNSHQNSNTSVQQPCNINSSLGVVSYCAILLFNLGLISLYWEISITLCAIV